MSNLVDKTEESVKRFFSELDKREDFGPKPLMGVKYSDNYISDVIECSEELFERPSFFCFDEQDQVYIELEDPTSLKTERFYLTSEVKDPLFQVSCAKIAETLPDITYDLECGGYPTRQSEVASLYKIAVVNKLQEGFYDCDISEILSGYDFGRWRGKDGNQAFTELLQRIQEESDSLSRVVISCCNNKLIADIIKKDTSYMGILKEEDADLLRCLTEEDARINAIFNKRYEGASTIKEKVLIGEELALRRKEMLSQKFVNEASSAHSITAPAQV